MEYRDVEFTFLSGIIRRYVQTDGSTPTLKGSPEVAGFARDVREAAKHLSEMTDAELFASAIRVEVK